MQTTPLSVLDELYLHLDRDEEAWSVHVEIHAEGHIDADRLERAARAAALRHPLARARLADKRATDVRYEWEIADELAEVDLRVVSADGLAEERERFLSRTPPLDRHGPFALLLAHDSAGDALVLNLHHAAGDGLAAVRLMASIARAYAGEDDPDAPVDPLAVRDLGALNTAGLKERFARGRALLDYLGRGVATPARIEPQGGGDRPGYGFELATFEPEEVEKLVELRAGHATLNDVLLAGLGVAVKRWNHERGADSGSVYLMMPINLRPSEWRAEVVGNFASYVSVRLPADKLDPLPSAVTAAQESTGRIKDGAIAGLILDLFGPPTALPMALKQRMQDLIPLTNNAVVDTAVLSNLGRLEDLPSLGDAGRIREVWFSPPGRMPLGASLGAATIDGRLFLTLRYRHALFDAEAARQFLATFKNVLA